MRSRIIFNIVFFAAVFYMPWWVIVFIGLAGVFKWSPYYEIIGFGVLFDVLYGAENLYFFGMIGLALSVFFFFVGSYARKIVRD